MKNPELRDLTKRKDLMKQMKLSPAEMETLDKFIKLAELAETKPAVFGKGGEVMWTPAAGVAVAVVALAYQVAKDAYNSWLVDPMRNPEFLNKIGASIKEMHKIDLQNQKSGSLDELLKIRGAAVNIQKTPIKVSKLDELDVNLKTGALGKINLKKK